jgi:hypothetical protein
MAFTFHCVKENVQAAQERRIRAGTLISQFFEKAIELTLSEIHCCGPFGF